MHTSDHCTRSAGWCGCLPTSSRFPSGVSEGPPSRGSASIWLIAVGIVVAARSSQIATQTRPSRCRKRVPLPGVLRSEHSADEPGTGAQTRTRMRGSAHRCVYGACDSDAGVTADSNDAWEAPGRPGTRLRLVSQPPPPSLPRWHAACTTYSSGHIKPHPLASPCLSGGGQPGRENGLSRARRYFGRILRG